MVSYLGQPSSTFYSCVCCGSFAAQFFLFLWFRVLLARVLGLVCCPGFFLFHFSYAFLFVSGLGLLLGFSSFLLFLLLFSFTGVIFPLVFLLDS